MLDRLPELIEKARRFILDVWNSVPDEDKSEFRKDFNIVCNANDTEQDEEDNNFVVRG